jgi:hypothetical protein
MFSIIQVWDFGQASQTGLCDVKMTNMFHMCYRQNMGTWDMVSHAILGIFKVGLLQ